MSAIISTEITVIDWISAPPGVFLLMFYLGTLVFWRTEILGFFFAA